MLYTSPSYARSSSAYSVGLPNMSQFMNASNLFNGSPKNKFQFNSPVRTYLKTNEIKQRKILHQTVVAKLSDIINNQGQKNRQRRSLQLVSRRCSTFGRTDKNQVLWEAIKIKFENEPYNQDLLFDFFQEIQSHSNHILVEKYNFPFSSKQEFARFKHHFINAFLHEQKLITIMMKIEELRQTALNKVTLYAELKGYSTISQIVDMLYTQIRRDITLQPCIININEQEFREFTIQLISNLIQQQDNGAELMAKIIEYSRKYNLNHVHFTQLKYSFYKILIEFNISQRAIRKVLKIFDYYKSALLRAKPMREHLNENTNLINEMVVESKNQEQQKRQLFLLFEYITNNHIRTIKKDDIILMKVDPEIGQQIIDVLKQLKPNQLLFQDFIQDLRSCLSQNYAIPQRLVYKFAKKINTIPFYARIYKENQTDYQKLICTEIDFISQNRTHFRKKELQLIHKRFNVTNEAYDAYIQKLQEVFGVYSQNMVTRLNHYRTWIVADTNN